MTSENHPTVTSMNFESVHHIGMTVVSLEESIEFWERLLAVKSRDRRILDAPHTGGIVGSAGTRIEVCWIDLPGSKTALELLYYMNRDAPANEQDTARPGNVHVCLQVQDMDSCWAHAVSCGAVPVSDAPIEVPVGPNTGAKAAYLRNPDGVTIELFQAAPSIS